MKCHQATGAYQISSSVMESNIAEMGLMKVKYYVVRDNNNTFT